jgi:hypothetical protein
MTASAIIESGPNWMVTEGPTPNGGVKALCMFSDENHNPVPREQATRCEIHEIGANGECLFRTYGFMNPTKGTTPAEIADK